MHLPRLTRWNLTIALGTSLGLVACAASRGSLAPAAKVAPPLAGFDVAYEAAEIEKLPATAPRELPGLHNLFQLSENIFSGAEPDGEESFVELQKLGVKTILSVDGKIPDAQLAARHGIRYVHVPIQYRGITHTELVQITKTFRELDGPFYVHCFHGQHRGPAAAAVGRLVLDGAPRTQALAEMRQWCGTSSKYEGLYLEIARGEIPDAEETAQYEWDFPAAHAFQGFRQAMVDISRASDNLEYLSVRDWLADAEHPDADAVNEATKLASTFAVAAELPETAAYPDDFREWLTASTQASQDLRDALRLWRNDGASREPVDALFADLQASCTACHRAYRN